jgi:DNA-directed RNA polymerase alpha subunit
MGSRDSNRSSLREHSSYELLTRPTLAALSIRELDLSVRSYNALRAGQINTLGQLVGLSDQTLLKFRNFGRKSLIDVYGALAAFLSSHTETRMAEAERVLPPTTEGIDHSSDSTRVPSCGGWKVPLHIASRMNGAPKATIADVLTAPVEVLNLSTRSSNVLIRLQIGSITELLAYPKQRMILAKNMGPKSLSEIESKVFTYLLGVCKHPDARASARCSRTPTARSK